jgi:hypothetical protein
MPGHRTSIYAKRRFLLWEKNSVLCVDTNCHSKSITVPVTVVLGLAAIPHMLRDVFGNPRQMSFFPSKIDISG